MSGPGSYTTNAAAMWVSLTPWARVRLDTAQALVIEVAAQGTTRAILRAPLTRLPTAVAEVFGQPLAPGSRVVVEDTFGTVQLPDTRDLTVWHVPAMTWPGRPAPPPRQVSVTVAPVTDEEGLATAEQVIVAGFPRPYPQRGQLLPAMLLKNPAWRVWLAERDGEPAGAGCTFDDGDAVGVHWVATLPEHRSQGVARALMTSMLTAFAGRLMTLVATNAGEPLYSSLGFTAVSTAAWYRRVG